MKFVRFGNHVINVSEIQAISRTRSGCIVYMKDGTNYSIDTISDETYESAIAYICCGGVNDA